MSGITRVTPPTITNTWRAKTAERPVARSFENESCASMAILKPRSAMSRQTITTPHAPNRPSSSVITE